MDSRTASMLSIGVLGGVAVAFTADVVTVPIWVVFLAWASFFFVGGGAVGWMKSVASNIVGVVIATASLYAAYLMGGSLLVTAIAVGVGSALMVQASWVPFWRSPRPSSSGSPPRCRRSPDEATTSPSPPSLTPAWSPPSPVYSALPSGCSPSTWRP